jgi:hypothetical protein
MKTPIPPHLGKRSMRIRGIIFTLLFFSFTVTTSLAHAPSTRELSGVIQTVDLNHRLIVFITDKGARKMIFAVSPQTRYVRDGNFVAAAALPEGTPAQIWYRTPFFGRRILTKVVWETH